MDFLDSNAFEQMAREYNKKYANNSISVLSSKNSFIRDEIKGLFCCALSLLENLKIGFKRYSKFNNFFNKAEIFKNDLRDFFKVNFCEELECKIDSTVNQINHKYCAINMLDTYINIFDFNIKVLNEIDKIKNLNNINYNENCNIKCYESRKSNNVYLNKDNYSTESKQDSFYEVVDNSQINLDKNSSNNDDSLVKDNIDCKSIHINNITHDYEITNDKVNYLLIKLYEIQEIFKIFTENLKEFYSIIN